MNDKGLMKISMVIDDYKLSKKDYWWRKSLKKIPHIERDFELVREEVGQSFIANTTVLYRYYRKKGTQ